MKLLDSTFSLAAGLLEIIALLGCAAMALRVFFAAMTPRQGFFYRAIAFIGTLLVSVTVLDPSKPIPLICLLMGYCITTALCFRDPPLQTICAGVVFFPAIVSFSMLATEILRNRESVLLELTLQLARLGLWILVWIVLRAPLHVLKRCSNSAVWAVAATLSSLYFACCLMAANSGRRLTQYGGILPLLFAPAGVFVLLFLLGYIALVLKRRNNHAAAHLQAAYFESLQAQLERARMLQNTLDSGMQTVYTLLSAGNTQTAAACLQRLLEVDSDAAIVYCGIPSLDALLHAKLARIHQNEIACEMLVEIADCDGFNPMDLCSILSSTLDNALEACLKLQDPQSRHIALKARRVPGFFCYSISNAMTGALKSTDDIPFTTKNVREYGFGLQIVRDIVEKYNGELEIEFSSSEFHLLLILPECNS